MHKHTFTQPHTHTHSHSHTHLGRNASQNECSNNITDRWRHCFWRLPVCNSKRSYHHRVILGACEQYSQKHCNTRYIRHKFCYFFSLIFFESSVHRLSSCILFVRSVVLSSRFVLTHKKHGLLLWFNCQWFLVRTYLSFFFLFLSISHVVRFIARWLLFVRYTPTTQNAAEWQSAHDAQSECLVGPSFSVVKHVKT